MARNQPTFAELRTEVRRYLNDLNGGIWSDAEINRNLNRAILKVWLDTEWEKKEGTFEGVTNASWYTWPSDWLLARNIRSTDWTGDEKIFPTDMLAMDKFDRGWEGEGASIPSRFFVYSYDRLYIWPQVDANSGNRTFTVEYVPVPLTVSSDSSVTLGSTATTPPLYISELIPLKAAELCWLRADWQKAMQHRQMYQQQLNDAQVTLRNTSSAKTYKLRPSGKFDKAHGSTRFKLRL